MTTNEFSFYYEINRKTYRLIIVKITSNGVYFRHFFEKIEFHTSYHRDGRYHWVLIPHNKNRKKFFPQKKPIKPPIDKIANFINVEIGGAVFTNPDFMEQYKPKTDDVKMFEKIKTTDNTNMFLFIGPDVSTFTSILPANSKIKESEIHSVEYLQTRVHIILVNFEV